MEMSLTKKERLKAQGKRKDSEQREGDRVKRVSEDTDINKREACQGENLDFVFFTILNWFSDISNLKIKFSSQFCIYLKQKKRKNLPTTAFEE